MGNPVANAQGDNLLYGGATDPRVNAIDLPINAIYIFAPDSGAGALLRKQDSGVTTNYDTLVTDAMERDFSNVLPAVNAIPMGGFGITGLLNPVDAQDAATKDYVDNAAHMALDFSNAIASAIDIDLGTNKLVNVVDPGADQDAATKKYVDDADVLLLPLLGGTMGGAIAMGTSKITGMGDPTLPQDAATKKYVDDADILLLPLGGGTMGGAIDMDSNTLSNVAAINAAATLTLLVPNSDVFKFLETGNAPTVADVWTCTNVDGSGYWAAAAAGGDLWSDPVDANINPDGISNRNIGTLGAPFKDLVTKTVTSKTTGTNQGSLRILNSSNLELMDFRAEPSAGVMPSATPTAFALGPRISGKSIGFYTANDAIADANTSGEMFIETGNKTAGTGDSGAISLKTGTSSGGARGKVDVDATSLTVPRVTADPATLVNGDFWYNTTSDELKARVGGVTVIIA